MRDLIDRMLVESEVEAKLDNLSTNEYEAMAVNMLTRGLMPDGVVFPGGKPTMYVGFDGEIRVGRVKRTPKRGGIELFTFEMVLYPGRGGGGGVGVSPPATNQWFNLAGTGRKQLQGMKRGFAKVASGEKRAIGTDLVKWFKVPENFVWRIAGYSERRMWVPVRKTLRFKKMEVNKVEIDPTRRRWPAGRTEVWGRLDLTVQIEMKRR